MLSLGVYPEVSLAQAREKRDAMRRDLKNDVNPAAKRRAEKYSAADSFEAVAREWFGKFSANWEESYSCKVIRRMELYLFPWIGARPIGKLGAREVLLCLQRVEAGAKLGTAKRALQECSRIFRYAIATGRIDQNPADHLLGAFPRTPVAHLAAITTPKDFGELLRAIEAYNGSIVVRIALQLAPLVFVRPGELRAAKWSEMNFAKAEWHIPAAKMKMRAKHIVPLSRQSIALLRDIRPLSGAGRYVFPSARSKGRPLSAVALLAALRAWGMNRVR